MKEMMTALFLEKFGSDAFAGKQVPIPQPETGQVLVRVRASGVNPIDVKIRKGIASYALPELPAIPGTDMAGDVVAVGDGVLNLKEGDEVYGLIGGVRGGLQGSLAQYAVADADLLAPKPRTLSMREAAAVPLTFLTAWQGLVDAAEVREGQKVLVQGGAGGVGHMAVQIAKAMGAEVWGTASASKQGLMEALGAIPIDYDTMSGDAIVDSCTGGEGFDIIYDTVGGRVLDDSLGMTRPYGHVASSVGFGPHDLTASSLQCATVSGVFVLLPLIAGINRAHHGQTLERAAQLIDAGHLRPVVDQRRFGMGQAIEAHKAVEDGSALVKIVIDME